MPVRWASAMRPSTCGGQLALRIDGEGQGHAVALRELLRELIQRIGVVDGIIWLAKSWSRYSSPRDLPFKSNQRALMAAWRLQL